MTHAQFLEFIVSVSIQATFIVCITHWLCRIVEYPRLQCRLWNTCHILLLLVVLSGLVLPHLRMANPWQVLSPLAVKQVVTAESVVGRSAFVVWIMGASASLLLLIREWARAFQFLKSCRSTNDQEHALVEQINEVSLADSKTQMNRTVQLLVSNHLGSPFCCQWHQPQLVIPEFMLKYHPEDIEFIARHELEHLRSGHPLQLFIERLVATAFWFHPAIWWASRQSSLVREYACDDAAVTEQREIVKYLKVLLAIAEQGLSEEAEGAKLFFGRGASIIALRGRRLLKRAESSRQSDTSGQQWWAQVALTMIAVAVSFVWVPVDALASSRTNWSPWPQWSSRVLRTFDIPARDFEPYDVRTRMFELSASTRHQEQLGPSSKQQTPH